MSVIPLRNTTRLMISELSAARDRLLDAICASLHAAAVATASAVRMVRLTVSLFPCSLRSTAPALRVVLPFQSRVSWTVSFSLGETGLVDEHVDVLDPSDEPGRMLSAINRPRTS